MSARRRSGSGAAAHGDDWLITYTDTITLLLCLFVALLSIEVSKRQHAEHPLAGHVDPVARFVALPEAVALPTPIPAVVPTALPLVIGHPGPAVDVDAESDDEDDAVAAAPPAPALAAAPVAAIRAAKLPASAPAPKPAPAPEPKAPRIYTAQISSAAFFGPGSATLSDAGAALLQDVAATVNAPRLAGYGITVEGHTDDTPIHSAQFPSNWELSSARAAAVVRFLLHAGVPASRLRAAGYADTFPLAPNRDAQGLPIAANQARNRRVVIRLEKVE